MDKDNLWTRLAAPGEMKDTKAVRGRLDAVVPGEWDLMLELLPQTLMDNTHTFKARLQILGVIRESVGSGENYKLAAQDAFLRAAQRFGIGE